MTKGGRKLLYLGFSVALAAGLALALRPAPIVVESSAITRGPLEVTTTEQGQTRAHDRYVVAAPVAGRLLRVALRDGDPVSQGQLVATMTPLPLSTRERDELQARVEAAESNQRGAEAQLDHVLGDLEQARRDSVRLEGLFANDAASRRDFEHARNEVNTLQNDVEAARYRAKAAAADLQAAKAGLIAADEVRSHAVTFPLRAPVSGYVLRVLEPSERVISPGTPILHIGDLGHLQVVLELLSTEAVKVAPGMPALIEEWGGARPLRARVRRVEPYAFTKVSALGIEEQRTNVLLDFVDSPGQLGDGYRVTGRIILWSGSTVLKAPLSSLYRCGSAWCVFVIASGRAHRRSVQLGHQSSSEFEILSGLSVNELVVRHPSNELNEGARVTIQP